MVVDMLSIKLLLQIQLFRYFAKLSNRTTNNPQPEGTAETLSLDEATNENRRVNQSQNVNESVDSNRTTVIGVPHSSPANQCQPTIQPSNEPIFNNHQPTAVSQEQNNNALAEAATGNTTPEDAIGVQSNIHRARECNEFIFSGSTTAIGDSQSPAANQRQPNVEKFNYQVVQCESPAKNQLQADGQETCDEHIADFPAVPSTSPSPTSYSPELQLTNQETCDEQIADFPAVPSTSPSPTSSSPELQLTNQEIDDELTTIQAEPSTPSPVSDSPELLELTNRESTQMNSGNGGQYGTSPVDPEVTMEPDHARASPEPNSLTTESANADTDDCSPYGEAPIDHEDESEQVDGRGLQNSDIFTTDLERRLEVHKRSTGRCVSEGKRFQKLTEQQIREGIKNRFYLLIYQEDDKRRNIFENDCRKLANALGLAGSDEETKAQAGPKINDVNSSLSMGVVHAIIKSAIVKPS